MKTRHVYLMRDLPGAEDAVSRLRDDGIPEHDIAMVARADIEMTQVPDDYRNASTDFMPAALRGALGGGSVGMLAGLIGLAVPAIGITVAGAAAIALIGAATGAWALALVGSALPDPIRRRFEHEIEAGRILLIVDTTDATHPGVHQRLIAAGAEPLAFTEPTVMG